MDIILHDLSSYETVSKVKYSPILSLAVLEGIAISFDPDYKVLGSTYPWIARKVLTDSSPKLKSSLQALLYKVKPDFLAFIIILVFILFIFCVYFYCIWQSELLLQLIGM